MQATTVEFVSTNSNTFNYILRKLISFCSANALSYICVRHWSIEIRWTVAKHKSSRCKVITKSSFFNSNDPNQVVKAKILKIAEENNHFSNGLVRLLRFKLEVKEEALTDAPLIRSQNSNIKDNAG
jgi:hypothetical protein